MAFILAKDTELHVATTAAGTYALLSGGLTIDEREETADDEEIFTFGSDTAIVSENEDVATIDMNLLLDPADTTGQEIVRAARRNGTSIFVRMLWDGPGGTAGEQFEARVLSFNRTADRNGTGQNKFVRGALSIRRIGPISPVAA